MDWNQVLGRHMYGNIGFINKTWIPQSDQISLGLMTEILSSERYYINLISNNNHHGGLNCIYKYFHGVMNGIEYERRYPYWLEKRKEAW